jgi:hypothetical protein
LLLIFYGFESLRKSVRLPLCVEWHKDGILAPMRLYFVAALNTSIFTWRLSTMKKLFKTKLRTTLAFASVLLWACQATSAFANDTPFVLDMLTGCKVFELNDADVSAKWSGACLHGEVFGRGTLMTKSKKKNLFCENVGSMVAGQWFGRVVAKCSDGTRAEVDYTATAGSVLTGKGKGTVNLPNGDKYEGEFKGFSLHGQGTYTQANGTASPVTFANNKLVNAPQHLQAKAAQAEDFVKDAKTGCKAHKLLEAENTVAWNGACTDGKISGSGVLVVNYLQDNASCTQTGEFKEGLKHGKMKIVCTDGSNREGTYVNGDADGKGVATGPDGDRWEGEYKNGGLNGQGTHTQAKQPKYKYQGAFQNNQYHGQGVQTFPDGEKRVGEFKEGGIIKGVATYPNHTKYEGEFQNEMPHGKGKLTYEFGTNYEGAFENGVYHGQGRLLHNDGDYQVGLFQNGKFVTGTQKETLEARKEAIRKIEEEDRALRRRVNIVRGMMGY